MGIMEEQARTIFDRLKITKNKRDVEKVDFNVSSFKVKALQVDGVHVDSLEIDASNDAVDVALGSIGSLESRNKHDTILKMSPKIGVEIISRKTKKRICSYSMHEIGYCNVDKRYPEIFVFMGAKVKSDVRCRIFLCDDQAKSRAICLTMAKCFETTFTKWQKQKENDDLNPINGMGHRTGRRKTVATPHEIEDLTTELRGRSRSVRSSSFDATYDGDFFGVCDIEMDRTFEKIMEKSAHQGKYSLLGRRGSTDWAAIEEDEEVIQRMQGGEIIYE